MRMLATRSESSRVALVLADQALLAAAWLLCLESARALGVNGHVPDPATAARLHLLLAPVYGVSLWAAGLYRPGLEPFWPRVTGTREVLFGALAVATALLGLDLVLSALPAPSGLQAPARALPFLMLGCAALGLWVSRLLVVRGGRRFSADPGRVVAFGLSRRTLRVLAAARRSPELRLVVVGVAAESVPDDVAPRLSLEQAVALVEQGRVDHVLIEAEALDRDLLHRVLALADREGVSAHITSSLFPSTRLVPTWERIEGVPLLGFVGAELPLAARAVKRVFDVVVALALLALFGLPMLLIAALVRGTSKGPALFRQQRVGTRGRVFTIVKFRTMPVGTEDAAGPGIGTRDDPRATPFGRLLRRSSLDELPQLFNVLAGHMSLVGPRPERPEFVRGFKDRISRYAHKHWVKPGLTGWAQIHGLRGSQTDLQERIDHDLYYIENWSLLFDIRILLRTAFDAWLRHT